MLRKNKKTPELTSNAFFFLFFTLYSAQQTVTYSSFCVYVNSVFSPRVTSRPCLAFVIVRLFETGKRKKENEEIILFGWAGAKGSLYPIGCIRCASSVVSCCYFFPFFCVCSLRDALFLLLF